MNYIRTLNIDEPLTRIKSDGTIRHYVTDALGSVIALTDDTGVVRTTYTYDPFGNTTISGESSDNPFQYTGRENDGTGLYYYRARYYSPELQRFISEDPILRPGDPNVPFLLPYLLNEPKALNVYSYTLNNPLTHTDPRGLFVPPFPPIPPGGRWIIPPTPPSDACCSYAQGTYVGDIVKAACLKAGDNPWANCVRTCLSNTFPSNATWIPFWLGPVHYLCFEICK